MRFPWQRLVLWAGDTVPQGGEPDDRDLVICFQQDPEGPAGRQAVSRLLERYRRRVLAWCWQVVKDREVALDLAQDVLVSAYQNLPRYTERQRFSAWLFAIARNRCLSELRRRRIPQGGEAVLELLADPGARPDQVLERKLDEETLLRVVAETLTPLESEALWLRCYEGLAVETITRRLDITESTGARAVLQRARRKLRRVMPNGGNGNRGGSR
jgi:RNA polymerase sigma-70 factor (ECF subfamily)